MRGSKNNFVGQILLNSNLKNVDIWMFIIRNEKKNLMIQDFLILRELFECYVNPLKKTVNC